MKGTNRFKLLSIVLVFSYLLSACSGAAGQPGAPAGGKPESREVAFTGTVEAVSAGQITVSGQVVATDAKTIMDPNIQVGDIVKVEAQVSESGAIIALKVESFGGEDTNSNSSNTNDANSNDDNTNAGTNDNTNSGDNTNSSDNTNTGDNSNTAGLTEQEIFGVVTAISAESVTVDGVTYQFASFTEFKDAISVGDSVKLHVIANSDGTFTVREIEKSDGTDDNSNNDNGNDDNSNDDNSNDDNANDDHGNDDNSNDDDGGDNGNGNGNGD